MRNILEYVAGQGVMVKATADGDLKITAQKGKLTGELAALIRENKAGLLEYLTSLSGSTYEAIEPAPPLDSYPLSSSQKRLWIISQFEEASIAYNIMHVIELKEAYDLDCFQQAIAWVIQRHEALRTVFREDGQGEVRQVILPARAPGLQVKFIDLRGTPHIEEAIDALMRTERSIPFDLSQGPLIRAGFLQTGQRHFHFYFVMHHIICDGWSMGILFNEVMTAYHAFTAGRQPALPALRLQYKDFSWWQQRKLADGSLDIHRRYWLEQLSGELPALELPGYTSRPGMQTYRGAALGMSLERPLVDRLKALCQRAGATLFMGIVAALQGLLYRYTGLQDLVIGTPVAGREHAELEGQIGFYINTLALRTQVEGNLGFLSLLGKVREVTLSAYAHQRYPFDRLVEELPGKRDTSRSPIFDIAVVLQNQQELRPEEDNTDSPNTGIRDLGPVEVKLDLHFNFWETAEGMELRVEYNRDVYTSAIVSRMMNHYFNWLDSLTTFPGLPVDQLTYLSAQEERQLLKDFNATTTTYRQDHTIVSWFREQVLTGPARTALVGRGSSLTYEELSRQTNQLAHYLRKEGVQRGDRVALCLDRSVELVLGILAILKAGAAYVPVDPSYPPGRIGYLIKDCGTKWVLSDSYYGELLEEAGLPGHIRRLYLDRMAGILAQSSTEEPEMELSPTDLAYVIYTSGSTGLPKGVMIGHTSMVNLIEWHIGAYTVNRESRSTMMAGVGFDAGALELWSGLLSGSTVYIIGEELRTDRDGLLAFLQTHRITHSFIPPGLIPGLVHGPQPEGLALRYILIGGDRLAAVQTAGLSYKLVNQYGPTESTVMVTEYVLPGDGKQPPIGHPIANVQLYILDPRQKLTGIGVWGELYIGGAGLAQGYWDRPELTADRFISHQFSPGSVIRLYKTGDLCRWREDGNIEYLGRVDEQVKIRGYRIELGEVEQALQRLEGIKAAVVDIYIAPEGDRSLVGYVVSEEEQSGSALRRELEAVLPAYMVPSYYVQLDHLPLTVNGKIDRKVLPGPGQGMIQGPAYIAPNGQQQEALSACYEEVLHHERVGIKDNFFELGGDSIKAILLVSRLKRRGFQIRVADVLKYPVLEDLATRLRTGSQRSEQGLVEGPVLLTPIQQWLLTDSGAERPQHYNQSILLYSQDRLDAIRLQECLTAIITHHDALRMIYRRGPEGWEQFNRGLSQGRLFHWEEHDFQTATDDPGQIGYYYDSLQQRMDLEEGPLVRAGLFHLADGDRLLLAIHHLVVDGISWRILLEDLSNTYAQLLADQAISLPPKSDSLRSWAKWQQDYVRAGALSDEIAYWRHTISQGDGTLAPKPGDTPRRMKDNDTVQLMIGRELTRRLQTNIHRVYRTEIDDILLSGFMEAMRDTLAVERLLIGVEGHGRKDLTADIDISRTVGWFTTVFPVWLSAAGDPLGTLVLTKEALREVPQKGIGYGMLRYLGNEELPDHEPRKDVLFNYLGDFGSGLTGGTSDKTSHLVYSAEYKGQEIDGEQPEGAILTLSGLIANGELQISIRYDRAQYDRTTMEQLSANYEARLTGLIERLSDIREVRVTPSDLGYKGLSLEDLKQLQEAEHGTIEDIYGLSPLQEGIYYHWLADKGTTAYIEQVSYRLRGKLDKQILQRSYGRLVERHGILRTSFSHAYGKGSLQIVRSSVEDSFSWEELSPASAEADVADIREQERLRGFDLDRGGQMRLRVLAIGQDDYVFIWSHHHILMDGWCVNLLIKEFYHIYRQLMMGQDLQLPGVRPYRTYIGWLDAQAKEKEAGHTYWERYLNGYEEASRLPFDEMVQPEEEKRLYEGDEVIVELTGELLEELQRLSRESGVTDNTLMQAAWGYLLSRYNNRRDVVYGTVVSGRPGTLDGVEEMIGLFINTIPVRVRYEEDTTIGVLLETLQQASIAGLPHHYLRLSELQEISGLGSGLFDHLLVYENYPVQPLDRQEGASVTAGLEDLELLSAEVQEHTNYDFNLLIAPGEGSTRLILRYNTRRYRRIGMERMADHLLRVLHGFAEGGSSQRVQEVSYLSTEEERQLLDGFNTAHADYPRDWTIVSWFEDQVKKGPDRIAVTYDDRSLSYRELSQQSNQLAHYLRKEGIQRGDRVALLLDRSIEWIVGILAVLKAGAAYVPLDPLYPPDRIEYMLSDSGAQWMINDSLDWDAVRQESSTPVSGMISPDDLAYVIYTSGSTGRPKGVMIEHANVIRLFNTDRPLFDFNETDVWTAFHSFCFDFSVWEMYGALFYGGRLVIVPGSVTRDAQAFATLLVKEGVTILNQTPGSFYGLMEELIALGDSPIRYVIFGGEALNPARLNDWRTTYPDCKLINMYGITETTVHVTYKEIEDRDIRDGLSNIGKAIPTLNCYIMDPWRQLQAIGIPGELYVGGAGLARGYLNRPELTADRFIQHTFGKGTAQRLYRTGDLCRWLDDGNIEYLGRIDEQVKIRGYRIEMGEVEHALQQCPQIADAVLAAKKDAAGNKYLIAYLVPGERFDQEEIIAYLHTRLPAYMIPSVMIPLSRIPLTANGKADRKTLLAMEETADGNYIAPRNDTEMLLQQVWKDVLGRGEISIKDNFFHIGGDSIKAINLISRLQKRLGRTVGIQELYRYNNIEELSRHIASGEVPTPDNREVQDAIRRETDNLKERCLTTHPGAEDAYPMSDIQKGMVFASLADPASAIYHDQFIYQRSDDNLSISLLTKALTLLVGKHEILRTSFNFSDYGEETQIVWHEVPIVIHYEELDGTAIEQRRYIEVFMARERSQPFDFSIAPIWRMAMFKCKGNGLAMVFQVHHAILDGWSVAAFNTELLDTCQKLHADQNFVPTPLKTNNRTAILHSLLERRNEAAISFWKKELVDYKRLDIFSRHIISERYARSYPVTFVDRLRAITRKEGISLNALFFGVSLYALQLLANEDDLTIGLVSSFRPSEEDGDQLLGCFLNTIPVRYLMPDGRLVTGRQYIRAIDAKLREIRNYDRITLPDIIKHTGNRSGNRNPFFDIIFNFVNFHIYEQLDKEATYPDQDALTEAPQTDMLSHVQTNTFLGIDADMTGGQLTFSYSLTRQFKADISLQTLHTLMDNFLMAYVSHPDERMIEYEVLPRDIQQQVLLTFNDTHVSYPEDKTIIDLFEEQVAKSGDGTALVCDGITMSYRELHERSNQLAAYLHRLGVRQESRVAICMERGPELIVAILGIWKAGGAYVPVDPAYPPDRIEYMLSDSGAQRMINDSLDWNTVRQEPSAPIGVKAAPNDLAYVIYTSGTTGNPKGVMITHANAYNFIAWSRNEWGKDTINIVYAATSVCFDLSIFELFYPLTTGKRLRILRNALSAPDFMPIDHNILLNTVPSVIKTYLQNDTDLSRVTALNMAGEPVPLSVRDKLDLDRIKVRNLYGPTESTTYSTSYVLQTGQPVLIGKPIANTRIYILGKTGDILPPGVAGELYIGGAGLARGYWGREDLTTERFTDHHFGTGPQQRLYRTGDIGRWLADGNIEYLGRIDNQVKIHGYRIELGEVEHALQQLEGIGSAVVSIYETPEGDRSLIGYVVSGSVRSAADLRQQLERMLPAYMVPTQYILLDQLPLTANGKIDRKALPTPDASTRKEADYIAPRTAVEQQVSAIWEQLLYRPRIGMADDFFMSGGDSLKLMQLANHYHRAFEIKLSIQDLFTHSTVASQAVLIEASVRTQYDSIAQAPVSKDYPVSDGQRRLWVLSQLEEGSRAYHLSGHLLLQGPYSAAAFSTAIRQVINRHEILRTVFREDEQGSLRQLILSEQAALFRFDYKDGEGWDSQAVHQYLQKSSWQHFDLSQGPLLRAGLLRTGEEQYIFHYTMHHIISDGWSMEVLRREIMHYYQCSIEGKTTELPALRLQYKDYAVWQQQQLSQPDRLDRHRHYWLQQLSGELPVLQLPTGKPRPPIQSYKGYALTMLISEEETQALRSICQSHQLTLFMGIVASLQAIFYRYTGQKDLILGTPIAGRDHVELEDQIGFYINTLVLRTQLKGDESFFTLLGRVREKTLSAYEHQSYPFDRLVEELSLKRDTSRSALFDVMVILQNQQENKPAADHPTEKDRTSSQELAVKFDMTFEFAEVGSTLAMRLEYNSAIYDAGLISRFMDHYRNLLRSLTAQPETAIGQLHYLSAAEETQLLETFNATSIDYPRDRTLPGLFAHQVAHHGEDTAICFQEKVISFRELDELSSRLANYLYARYSLTAEDLACVMLERSEWLVISLLAVLKTGAAYVPIDPSYPQERIDYIISDSQCQCCIDADELHTFFETMDTYAAETPVCPAREHNLAYVIYTSGSTGRPKGCMLEQTGVVNRIEWMWRQYGFTRKDIILQKTAFVFDVSVWEIFMPLCWGCQMVICEKDDVYSPQRIATIIADHQVSCLHFVPGMLSAFIKVLFTGEEMLVEENQRLLSTLKRVITSGEALSLATVNEWYSRMNTPIYNLYGPTEASVDVSYFDTEPGLDSIPIGKPVANTSLYILNTHQELVPVGIAGEICIGGIQVARGYLNRDELTKEKFITDPFSKTGRLYRTGDLGRWREDGNIEYLGRIDDQVKIRGFRIELGEVEHALQQLEGVGSAVVKVYETPKGDRSLVGYIVSKKTLSGADLRQQLERILPAYMVPSYFVQLDQLPLTVNGKIDRKALPAPGTSIAEGEGYVAPKDDRQSALVSCFQEVLHRERVSIRDSFFELGGDSIKAILLINRLKQRGYFTRLADILKYPVLEDLAERLSVTETELISDQGPVEGPVILTPVQRWFLSTGAEGYSPARSYHHFNQSVLLYSAAGIVRESLEKSLEMLISHHDALRMIYRQGEDGWEQYNRGIEEGLLFHLEEHDLRPDPTREPSSSTLPDARRQMGQLCSHLQAGINLEQGPLLRAGLFRLEDGDRLLLVIHHLVVDGVSWHILLEDLSTSYAQAQKGEDILLPPRSDSFQRWAAYQQEYVERGMLRNELSYWQSVVRQGHGQLPIESATTQRWLKDTASVSFSLGSALTNLLQTSINHVYNTDINDVLLTALTAAAGEVFGVDRLLMRLEGFGRQELGGGVNITRTVGWFTTIYPVWLHRSDDILTTLVQVKEQLRGVPQKGIGYGMLRYLGEPGLLEEMGRPDITFNYLGDFGRGVGSGKEGEGSALFGYSSEYRGREMGGDHPEESLLTVSGLLLDGDLQVNIHYSKEQYREEKIARLSGSYSRQLETLIGTLSTITEKRLTPADLSYKGLSVEELEELKGLEPGKLEEVYGLSPLQEGIYYHWLANPSTTAYVEQVSYRLRGTLDPSILEQSYQALITRHAVLRTAFHHRYGPGCLQVVRSTVPDSFAWERIDPQEETIARAQQEERRQGFNLSYGGQMRLRVLDLGTGEYVFIWSHHHILMDGWCISVLIREFYNIYRELLAGREPRLSEPSPYADYISWLSSRNSEESRLYWERYLSGYEQPGEIPFFQGQPEGVYAGGEVSVLVKGELLKDMRRLCRSLEVTENTFIQAAWGYLLSRYNDTRDVVYGVVVSGRPGTLDGVEEMIGLFINTIAVRVRYEEDTTVGALLTNLQWESIAGMDHHYLRLSELQRASELGNGLFDHLLIYENYPVQPMGREAKETVTEGLEEMEVLSAKVEEETNYDFTMLVAPGEEQLRIVFRYNEKCYRKEDMHRLGEQLLQVIDGFAKGGDQLLEGGNIQFQERGDERVKIRGSRKNRRLIPAEKTYVPPGNDVEVRLTNIWKNVLEVEEDISIRDNFFETGGHSIRAILLLSAIFKEFGVTLSMPMIFEEPTIEGVAKKILNTLWFANVSDTSGTPTTHEKIKI